MVDQPLEVLSVWTAGDRMLFVYRNAAGMTYGLDCADDSPIGTSNPRDDDLAQEIAFYRILEPRGSLEPICSYAGQIHWLGDSPADHPLLVSDLSHLRHEG